MNRLIIAIETIIGILVTILICTFFSLIKSTSIAMTVSDNKQVVEEIEIQNEVQENNINDKSKIENEIIDYDRVCQITSNTEYYIKVNCKKNVVTVYKYQEGKYNPIKAMICSIGEETPTNGIFNVAERWKWLKLQGNVYGQYATQITGNILFHSVPYLKKSNDSLEYWEYDKLGEKASLGCVRLRVEDAKWIYDNIERNACVEFYESENPGPLGKPEIYKISNNIECRNWDPTDISKDNPWNK